jgi:Pyruvate/2-oxoacid:ferredoxin oxidoreductase gamma subunit
MCPNSPPIKHITVPVSITEVADPAIVNEVRQVIAEKSQFELVVHFKASCVDRHLQKVPRRGVYVILNSDLLTDCPEGTRFTDRH